MTKTETLSTGRRVWLWTAVIISGIVLLLAAAGIIGTWVGRSVVIDVADGVLDGVYQLAGVGREGVVLVNGHTDDLRVAVEEVETAVDEISQNVSDKGLVLTLLPPEKEQKLADTADRIDEAANNIRSIVVAVVELIDAVSKIPFVNIPEPDPAKVESLQSDILAIQTGVDQLAADIQAFRDDAAGSVDKISGAAGEVASELGNIQDELATIDSNLNDLQTRTGELKSSIRFWTFFIALGLSLLLAWVIYGMVMLIRQKWAELHA